MGYHRLSFIFIFEEQLTLAPQIFEKYADK